MVFSITVGRQILVVSKIAVVAEVQGVELDLDPDPTPPRAEL